MNTQPLCWHRASEVEPPTGEQIYRVTKTGNIFKGGKLTEGGETYIDSFEWATIYSLHEVEWLGPYTPPASAEEAAKERYPDRQFFKTNERITNMRQRSAFISGWQAKEALNPNDINEDFFAFMNECVGPAEWNGKINTFRFQDKDGTWGNWILEDLYTYWLDEYAPSTTTLHTQPSEDIAVEFAEFCANSYGPMRVNSKLWFEFSHPENEYTTAQLYQLFLASKQKPA